MLAQMRQLIFTLCEIRLHHDKMLHIPPKFSFTELAKSVKNRLHFDTHSWEHDYMSVLSSNKVDFILTITKPTPNWDKLCITHNSIWWGLVCETRWKTCYSSTAKLLGWICMAQSVTGHRCNINAVHGFSSATSSKLHSCIQLVAETLS